MQPHAISGKLLQLRRARAALWPRFVAGWLKRKRTGVVPCVVRGGRGLLKVPLADFYESYGFFCESPMGIREMDFFLGQLRDVETFYDIGGFRGAYSAMTRTRLAAGATVHIFEPLPKNFAAIERIRDLNRFENLTAVPLAVGDGTAVSGRVNEGDAMLRLGDARASAAETTFAAVSLDEYVARGNPPPTVIKIDVDGFELHVLRGGRQCLQRHRPRLWLEVHPGYLKAQGQSEEDVLGLLRELGYTLSFFDDHDSPDAKFSYHVWCE